MKRMKRREVKMVKELDKRWGEMIRMMTIIWF